MATFTIKVLSIQQVTHNVRSYTLEKPSGYAYTPGQATDVSLLKEDWESEKRPFTFTSLPTDEHLQFTIKNYTDHDGVTNQLLKVQAGDAFEIGDAWGTIEYKGEGVFIAGGAGVTPFIAILRHLNAEEKLGNNQLLFSNKTVGDIILKDEFETMLGSNFKNIISEELTDVYPHGRIDKNYLQQQVKNFKQPFYVCGPDEFTKSILAALNDLGADADTLVFEK